MRRADITPPVGIYHRMWGAAVHDRAEGIHRPLLVTAMVFRPLDAAAASDSQQVLVALDHCLFGAVEMTSLLDSISVAAGLPADCVSVVFSHTHAAGLMSLDRVALPGGELITAYLHRLDQTVAQLVAEASHSVEPAVITYGLGHCGLAAHRDLWDETRQHWACGFNPTGPADDTLLVARVTGADDRVLATLVNYACHPTTLAWQNRLISPDFPGALRETVEQHTGAPCVFLQGASGDLGPREGFVGDVRAADQNGRQLAFAALSVLTALPPPKTRFVYQGPVVSGATLGTWAHETLPQESLELCTVWRRERLQIPLPYREDLPKVEQVEQEREQLAAQEATARAAGDENAARDARALVERKTRLLSRLRALPQGPEFPYDICVWRVGHAVWLCVQGEPYHEMQQALRRRFPDVSLVICGLAGGWGPSYLPTRDTYGQGIYQESVAVLPAGSLERVIEAAAQCIERSLA
jgi:hypothetical protein